MKNLLTALLVIAITAAAVFSQNSRDEQEVLKLNAQIDEAIMKKDLSFFEENYAADYVEYTADGTVKNRAESLDEIRSWFASPRSEETDYKVKSEDVKIKMSGDLAVVTAKWSDNTKHKTDQNMPVHIDRGFYTVVFERQNGKWKIASEHSTDTAHDKNQTETELIYTDQLFYNAVQKKDREALNRYIADEYTFTEPSFQGNKKSIIAFFTAPGFKYISADGEGRKFTILGNTAIETGKVRLVYDYEGKRHDQPFNYTSIWVRRDSRWQTVADHFTEISRDQSNTEAEIKAAKQIFYRALETKDKEALNRHFADDYVFTDESRTGNKDDVIAYLTSPEFNFASGSGEDKKYINLGDDGAIEIGKITMNLESGGKQTTQVINHTTVWRHKDGRWQVVADHFSPVARK